MGVRRTAIALAVLVLVAGCGGAKATSSSKASAKSDPADAAMEQRLAVPQPPLPPAIDRPKREHGAMFARYFIADTLDYAMRSGFTDDSSRGFDGDCTRCWSVWKKIDQEYKQGHHLEMSPIRVDTVRVRRGPITQGHGVTEMSYWVVDVVYHVDKLSILAADRATATGNDLEFTDRLVVSYDDYEAKWRVELWQSLPDADAPILGPPAAA